MAGWRTEKESATEKRREEKENATRHHDKEFERKERRKEGVTPSKNAAYEKDCTGRDESEDKGRDGGVPADVGLNAVVEVAVKQPRETANGRSDFGKGAKNEEDGQCAGAGAKAAKKFADKGNLG